MRRRPRSRLPRPAPATSTTPHSCGPPSAPYSNRIAGYNIAFTSDRVAGLVIEVSGAAVHDRWAWRYYWPGALFPVVDCWARLAAAGDPGNTSGMTALIHNCTSTGAVAVSRTYPGGCPCSFDFGGAASIASTVAREHTGTWQVFVDYLDHDGTAVDSLLAGTFDLQVTPLVAVLHGWESNCAAMNTLQQLTRQELAIPDDHVQCYGYESRKGVVVAACGKELRWGVNHTLLHPGLGPWLSDFGAGDPEQPNTVHIVAHSMGGLVARDYAEHCKGAGDPGVGTISMLGTPNLGVDVAQIAPQLCPWYAVINISDNLGVCAVIRIGLALAGIDPHSQAVTDLAPDSSVLKTLNEPFTPSPSTVYRAHAGEVNTGFGLWTSSDPVNDCFVGETSVFGPDAVFNVANGGRLYPAPNALSHTSGGIPDCGDPTLTNDMGLVDNVVADIKAYPYGAGPLTSAPAPAVTPAAAASSGAKSPLLTSVIGTAHQGQQQTQQVTIPAGVGSAFFTVSWMDADVPPDLGFQLQRPQPDGSAGGAVVSGGDPDVLAPISMTDGSALYVLMKGFVMDAPAAGTWQFTITGDSVPEDGQPYLIQVKPDSQVGLGVEVSQPLIPQGQPELISAQMLDGASAVAPSSISGSVTVLDGTQQAIDLRDDGTGGDLTAGDMLYSATFDTSNVCGTFRIKIDASGSTSEGVVNREQLSSFNVQVADDTIGDPCNVDDDEDGLTDSSEVSTYGTDPMEADTDGDGVTDGDEVNVYHTEPLAADTDIDGLTDGAELHVHFTDPLAADTDGDGVSDGPLGLAGPPVIAAGPDNCPLVANADQANTDAGNAALNRAGADTLGDACDDNISGDGYSNAQHVAIGKDPSAYCTIMRADVNMDGKVTLGDLILVSGYYIQTIPPAPDRYNQNGDAKITLADLILVSGVYNQFVTACP